jgi:hypothetical protein
MAKTKNNVLANVARGANGVRKFYNENKDIIVPVAAAIGDMVLTNQQKQVANNIYSRLQNDPNLKRIDRAISQTYGSANDGAIIPHIPGAPVSIGSRFPSVRPKFVSKGQSVTITHRECLRAVSQVATDNVLTTGLINPYNPYVFPWLATVAGSYDKYKFTNISFEYVPVCSTGQDGAVALAWDPAGSDSLPDFYDLMNMKCVQTSSWLPAKLTLPPSTEKFMGESQSGTGSFGNDYYTHGQLFLGVMGGTDGRNVGQLYVSYTVVLSHPQPTTGLSSVYSWTPTSSANHTNVAVNDGFTLISGPNGISVPMGTWKVEVLFQGTTVGSPDFQWGGGIVTTNELHSPSSTICHSTIIVKSGGYLTSTLTYQINFAAYSWVQARITRVDPTTFNSSGIRI